MDDFRFNEYMELAKVAIESVLSWPVAALFIAVLVLHRIGNALSIAIEKRGFRAKGPGYDLAIGADQSARDEKLATTSTTANGQDDSVSPLENSGAKYWHLRFCELFLVPRTKALLAWLSVRQSSSLGDLDTLLRGFQPAERNAMIQALVQNTLLSIADTTVSITPYGTEYLMWRKSAGAAELPGLDAFLAAADGGST